VGLTVGRFTMAQRWVVAQHGTAARAGRWWCSAGSRRKKGVSLPPGGPVGPDGPRMPTGRLGQLGQKLGKNSFEFK
jgi:hypothetical protein